MVGRTPEFLGKKVEAREIKLTVIGTIAVPMMVLVATALAIGTKWGAPSIYDSGPQGFSETLYAYVSQAQQQRLGVRRLHRLPPAQRHQRRRVRDHLRRPARRRGDARRALPAAAGRAGRRRLARRQAGRRRPASGTLRTDTPTFVVVLISVILIVALLTFVPALLLGPVVQGLTDQLF